VRGVSLARVTSWVPDDVDTESPSVARVYDYMLGGGHNFEVDRALAERLLAVLPARDMARMNRQFLRRAVLYMIRRGVTQFLDLGSGIPTVGNVHEVAQQADPKCRVVYVDNESVAIAHSRMLLNGNANATALLADIRDPGSVLNSAEVGRLLDLSRPLGLLMVAVTPFVPDEDDPWDITAQYRDALAPDSLLALSACTADNDPAGMATWTDLLEHSKDPMRPRSWPEIRRFFDGFAMVEPGLVYTPLWRPELGEPCPEDIGNSNLYAGVGRKTQVLL
jgi:SAM-dependent methyltransferase